MIEKKLIYTCAIAGITLFALYEFKNIVTKEEKKYAETPTPNHPNTEPVDEEPKTVTEKIKVKATNAGKAISRAAKKMTDKITSSAIYEKALYAYARISAFLIVHENGIRSLKEAILLIAAFITLKNALNKGTVPRRAKPLKPVYHKVQPDGRHDCGWKDDGVYDFVKYLGSTDHGEIRNREILGDKAIEYVVREAV